MTDQTFTTDMQGIVDHSELRKWRTELPNLYDDADLDVYEFRLLVHYKRVGNCFEGLETTARKCHMSTGKASQARTSLAVKGWIGLESRQTSSGNGWTVTVIDRWEENFAHYSSRKPKPSPHEGFLTDKPSPGEGASPHLVRGKPSPGEAKKLTSTKNKQNQERGAGAKPAPRHPALLAFMSAARISPDKAHESTITDAVGTAEADVDFWKQVVGRWCLHGWSKRNVAGMLDYYGRRELPAMGKPGQTPAPKAPAAQDPEAVNRAKAALERARAGNQAGKAA